MSVELEPVVEMAAGDELMPGVVSYPTSLAIETDLRFNEWRELGENLRAIGERAAWALGDHRVYGDRFADEYADGLAAYDRAAGTVAYAEVTARAFSPSERSDTLSWSHHSVIANTVRDRDLRLRWLSSCERGGWPVQELRDRLGEGKRSGPRPPALALRAVGDVATAFNARAAALHVTPRDLALEVLELAAQLDDPVAALIKAGAVARGAGAIEAAA